MTSFHKISCLITSDSAQQIDTYCCENGISRSEFIRILCEDFFKNYERKKKAVYRREVSAELATIGIDILLQKFAPELRQGAIERARNTVERHNAD